MTKLKNQSKKDMGENFIKQISPYKEKRILITGHGNVDVDSYVSMVLLSDILKALGFNAVPFLIYKKIDPITQKYIDEMNICAIEEATVLEDDVFILVDHNSPVESVGLETYHAGRIIGVIDHHLISGYSYDAQVIMKIGSTASLIYDIFESMVALYIYKEKVLKTLLIDTVGLLSEKAAQEDKEFAYSLCSELGLTLNALVKWSISETDLTKSVEEILTNGLKSHIHNGKKITSSYVESFFETKEDKTKIGEVIDFIYDSKQEHILIIKDFSDMSTLLYAYMPEGVTVKSYIGLKSRNNILKEILI